MTSDDAPERDQPRKVDGRSRTSAANGKNAGIAPGTELPTKRTYDPLPLAETIAATLLAGKSLPVSPMTRSGPITEDDRRTIVRITGKTAEEFQGLITARTQEVAILAIDLIKEKLTNEPDKQKLYELTGLFAVSMDKLAALSGRNSSGGNVSVQINNYGTLSRDQLLGMAKGSTNGQPSQPAPEPINVSASLVPA